MAALDDASLSGGLAPPVRRERAVTVRRVRRSALYVVSRLLTLLVASFLIFAGLSAAPGDVVSAMLGGHPTPAARAHLRHALHLDQPMLERYWHWLSGVLHGDLGTSIVYKTSVSSLISPRIATTLFLVGYSLILVLLLGIVVGIAGGVFPRMSTPVTVVVSLLLAIPSFLAAQLLMTVFALNLHWFPVSGDGSGFTDRLHHLTLPAIALCTAWSAWLAQVTRAAVAEARVADYVDTARGRGISTLGVFRRHVLRTAAVPIVTVSALAAAGLFASAVVIENAFTLNGLGSLLVNGVSGKDYPVVQAVSVIYVAIFILTTSVIDGLHHALDPRVRRGGAR